MSIGITQFRGQIPKINDRRLPGTHASIAINCDFDRGLLEAMNDTELVHTLGVDALTIFRDGATWLSWPVPVDVVRGPVAQNRLYFTGDGAPKVRAAGVTYGLALPPPAAAPSVTNSGAPSAIAETVLYAYTWVTLLGEESQPSPLSAPILHSPGLTQTIAAFSSSPAARGITHKRIYRSQTSASGATSLFFAAEIPVADASYIYNDATTPLGEVIPTLEYDPPPDDLRGIISLPNGFFAAFRDRELFFSEPYRPHAWPNAYSLTVDYDIVGIVAFGSNIAVLTEETPYIAQGLAPESMVMEKMETGQPCLSRNGIIDMGYAAIYPSNEGLVMMTANSAEIVTRHMFTPSQWKALSPETILAARDERKYLFLHNIEDSITTYDCGGVDGWPELDIEADFRCGGPVLSGTYVDFGFGGPFTIFGARRLGVIDFDQQPPDYVQADMVSPISIFRDNATGELFFLSEDQRSIYLWQSETADTIPATWTSKLFSSTAPISYGAVFIRTERALADGDEFEVTINGDGMPLRTLTTANQIDRLPGEVLNTEWTVDVKSSVPVVAIYIGQTPDSVMMMVSG